MLLNISLKYISNCPINNIPALVQIMAWCRSGDKPLSEPMMDATRQYSGNEYTCPLIAAGFEMLFAILKYKWLLLFMVNLTKLMLRFL